MPRPGEQYLIRPRLSRPRCPLLYRALNPTMGLAKFLFVLVMPSLILNLLSTSRANRLRSGEAATTPADKIGYRRSGVPQCFKD
jgi:hypothetical protein